MCGTYSSSTSVFGDILLRKCIHLLVSPFTAKVKNFLTLKVLRRQHSTALCPLVVRGILCTLWCIRHARETLFYRNREDTPSLSFQRRRLSKQAAFNQSIGRRYRMKLRGAVARYESRVFISFEILDIQDLYCPSSFFLSAFIHVRAPYMHS